MTNRVIPTGRRRNVLCAALLACAWPADAKNAPDFAAALRSPAKFGLAEHTARSNAAARAGLEGEVVRVPFHVENTLPLSHPGLSVQGGIPLPHGAVRGPCAFRVLDEQGAVQPAQVNQTAYWPDGSLKWVLVILQASLAPHTRAAYTLEIRPGAAVSPPSRLRAEQTAQEIRVDTGPLHFSVPKRGSSLLNSLTFQEGSTRVALLGPDRPVTLIAEIERRTEAGVVVIPFVAGREAQDNVAILEEAGPERVVIRVQGVHRAASGEEFAPFTLRLYAHAGSSRLRFAHSFVYTGNPQRDFLRALGVRLRPDMPSLFAIALGGDQGTGHRISHNAGTNRPVWRHAVLAQNDSLSYAIRKWVDARQFSAVKMEEGGRSQGWGRLESAGVAVAVGLKNFWQEHPKAIAVDAETRELTAYFYSPYAEALDLRRYSHLTHAELYETSVSGPSPAPQAPEQDWQGHLSVDDLGARYIGKSSEFFLDFSSAAAPDRTSREALFFQTPPWLGVSPAWIARTRVFGDFAPASAELIRRHGQPVQEAAAFLLHEQEARKWYGFLDHGDMIHSYDPGRDIWCRDEGGYAWNNNEHGICEGLWTAFLHTGDVRIFRAAAAMTQHLGDVDMYHLGPLAGNGTRHNVNHYGCSAKKRRMTLPENKRMHYYFTGDEHTRDLIHFIHRSFTENQVEAEVMKNGRNTMDLAVYASALLFLWETTQEAKYGELLRKTTEALCAYRINGRGFRQYVRFDPVTGEAQPPEGAGLAQSKFRLNPQGKPPEESAAAQTKSFLLRFGPMDLLLNTAELTGSEIVHNAILEWAELLHLPEAEVTKYQGRFKGALDCGRVASYAYRFTEDPRYRQHIAAWLGQPVVWFETVGKPGDILHPPHRIPRNGDRSATAATRDRERFQLRDMADLFRNTPYCYAVSQAP